MINKASQAGFTAIELLITLIVASMFLFAGYQIYTQVTRDGSDANKVAVLSNKVNEKLRSLTGDSTITCTTTRAPETIAEPGIGSVTYTRTISCPNPGMTSLKLIRVEASYDNNTKRVQHAAYSN